MSTTCSIVFNLFIRNIKKKTIKRKCFPYYSPQKGTFTLTPGMGVCGCVGGVGDHFGPQIPTNHKQIVRTTIVHTSGTCFKQSQKISQNVFKIASYILKDTQNTINAFKITVYNTKHPNHTKKHCQRTQHFRTQFQQLEKSENKEYLLHIKFL